MCQKNKFFFIALIVILTGVLYARPMDDKSYEFHDPIQYKLKIQKDVFINKLNEISRVTEKDDEMIISFRMLSIKNILGEFNIAYPGNDYHRQYRRGNEDAIFYFYVQFIENDNTLLLKKCDVKVARGYSKEPEQHEIIDVFNQNVIDYLEDKPIVFDEQPISYQNYFVEPERLQSIEINKYEIWPDSPDSGPWPTGGPRESDEYEPFFWAFEWYNIYHPYDDLYLEITKKILQFNWILNKLDFPPEYKWRRFPKIEIKIRYQSPEDDANKFERLNYYIHPGNIVYFSFFIWENNGSYYCQLFPSENYFYSVDMEILDDIFRGINFYKME